MVSLSVSNYYVLDYLRRSCSEWTVPQYY